MSLADVGRDDLTRSFLSLVELGRSRISLRALSIVASRLDLPISYFLEDAPGTRDGGIELVLDYVEADVVRGKPDAALEKLGEPGSIRVLSSACGVAPRPRPDRFGQPARGRRRAPRRVSRLPSSATTRH